MTSFVLLYSRIIFFPKSDVIIMIVCKGVDILVHCYIKFSLTDLLGFFIQVEAVDLIGDGKAPRIPQPEEGATYDKIWKKKEVAKVNAAFSL